MTSFEEYRRYLPTIRFIEPKDCCETCNGSGYRVYGATWRSGSGGQALTEDVCNKCWGSGNKHKSWPSHQEFQRMKRTLDEDARRKAGV